LEGTFDYESNQHTSSGTKIRRYVIDITLVFSYCVYFMQMMVDVSDIEDLLCQLAAQIKTVCTFATEIASKQSY